MLRFLIALLREGPPAVCYWIVPIVGRAEKPCHRKVSSGIHADEDRCVPADKCSDYYVGLLENEKYVQQEYSSSLIPLDVRFVSDSLGWRSIHSRRGSIFRELRR